MAEKKSDDKIRIKARVSFLIEIEADDKESYDEAIEDLKFHYKNSRTSMVSVEDGRAFTWRIVKQRKEDVIVKKIKDVK
jgi:hypothetical protein